jgi:hypothetical protein
MDKTKDNTSKTKQPWPTKDAMAQVYALNLWGKNNEAFYSGDGSHHPEIVQPYLEAVIAFLSSFEKPLVVCDLGCGDFNIGKNLVVNAEQYIAIDIVEDLIHHNKSKYQLEKLSFHCLDIATAVLPKGDCAIVRQVLQHLSNDEIQIIIKKLTAYKYIILTEHLPAGDFIPNKDIISGQGIRIKKQSGLDLLAAPFHLVVKDTKQLSKVVLNEQKGVIVTTLYHMS